MTPIPITISTLGFRVGVTPHGVITGSAVPINTFADKFIHWTFDQQERRWKLHNEYYHYDVKAGLCYFPLFALGLFKEFLKNQHLSWTETILTGEIGEPAPFHMLHWVTFKNKQQEGAFNFLTDENGPNQRGLALQTGLGKTVSFIMAIQKLGVRSMITMTSRLNQWVGELTKYTSLEEDDIYIVKGNGSLTKLFNQIDTLKPKVILMSTQTMKRYLVYGEDYNHLPHPTEMCEKLGVGVVGTDEYHEHFHTNYLIGMLLNPALFIPITATFTATDPFVKGIFDNFIPKTQQFNGGAYNRYVNVTAYSYTSGGYFLKPYAYTARKMYSQVVFENWMLGKGQKFLHAFTEDALLQMVRTHYISIKDPGEKFLLLCATTALCDYWADIFKRKFNCTVSVFHSGMPANILEEFEMIVSTPGSAGTGRDIKNLRTCISFVNTNSEILNLQFLGRLRPPPAVKNTPEYAYVSIKAIPQHVKYAQTRAMLYSTKALKFNHRSLS